MAPSISNGGGSGEASGCNYIEHQVTKMDTLAGIAIKYGVEVTDIKRMNGLATDLQMFALKTLRIPLPGRHPPSPVTSNGSTYPRKNSPEKSPPLNGSFHMLESFESLMLKPPKKVSPAMNTLQKYYGLKSPIPKSASEGMEMAVYRTGNSHVYEDTSPPKPSTIRDLTPKSESLRNGFVPEDSGVAEYGPLINFEDEGSSENSVWRHQKLEADFGLGTPEKLLKEENSGGSTSFSTITGKNLDLRRKSASRTTLVADAESSWSSSIPNGFGDSSNHDEFVLVRKSSSSSSLQDQEGNTSSSNTRPIKWTLKHDFPVMSAASIAKPIFDGIPIPISGRKNKAALD
ncbi:uncharacterized protein LOC116214836 [Punica granatum]|uniref:LysM domain-containing protein n=2 Tax=Punica granatum TaxID=22663 RepID=A0A218VS32_PUNGR|nr:uncharacterized protein LOC116214836 [Punica granatum]OWM62712.1 hypothetical protein CDL15_Pgr020006 [Punica granatum]PKI55259.1 hypothetical protein CRG98_024275 [Punica granatum]